MRKANKTQGEVSMKKNLLQSNNSSGKRRIALVLILTMLLSTFMHQGWYNPKPAFATIGTVTAWTTLTSTYHTATKTPTVNVAIGGTASTKRLLVFAVSYKGTAGTATCTASYGGTAMQLATGDPSGTSSTAHTWIFYMLENDALMNGTARALAATVTGGGTVAMTDGYYAVYNGVDQTSPISNSQNVANVNGTTAAFGTGLTVLNNEQGVVTYSIVRTGSATASTISGWSANWSQSLTQNSNVNPAHRSVVGIRTVPASDQTPDILSTTVSSTSIISMSAISIKPAPSAPVITAPTAASITNTAAALGATISDGGLAITARGTCWSATTPVGTTNCAAEGGTASGAFTQVRTGFTAGTQYYYTAYATNSLGTTYSSEGSFYTEPTTQASGVNFTSVGTTGMTVNWTRGSGDGVIVLIKANSAVDSDPVDGTYTGYTANAAFGSGTQIGSGNYLMFKGTGTSVTVTGLTPGTGYYVAVYEYKGLVDTSGINQGVNYKTPPAISAQATSYTASALNAWSNVYHGTATTAQVIPYTVPAGSGTNRVMVVAIASDMTAVGARTVTLSYGNQNLTLVNGDMGTATIRQHTALYYLNEAGLDAATDANLRVTVSGGTTRMTDVFVAVYDNIDQATPITDSKTYNGGTTAVTTFAFATALTVNANDQAIEIITCDRTANTTLYTITYAANWTMSAEQTSTTTDAIRNAVATRAIPGTNTTDTSSTTFSGAALASMTGMSLKGVVVAATPKFSFSAANYNKAEGDSGTTTATITVNRSMVVSGSNSVNYATSDGTATAGEDYAAASNTMSFAAGETSKTFTVTINGDTKYEDHEIINLSLSSPTGGATLGSPSTATLAILNDDLVSSVVGFNAAASAAYEFIGSALLRVDLSPASWQTVTVTYNTANGTAIAPGDYTAVVNGNLVFNPGETTKNISITIANDGLGDPNETFRVTLSSPVNAYLSSVTTHTVTIKEKYDNTSSCGSCHGYTSSFDDGTSRNTPTGAFVGSHNKHVVQAGIVCAKCHITPADETSANYAHRTGAIQMASPINGDTGGAYGKASPWAQTNSPSSMQACSNVYCHSQGTGATLNSGDTRGPSSPGVALNWGAAGACNSCHGYPPNYANQDTTWGAAKANSHSKHQAQCSTCHNSTTLNSMAISSPANHANKTYDIVVGNGATIGGYTYDVAGGTCTTISCHSNGTSPDTSRQWGGASLDPAVYKCTTCHNVSHAITSGPLAGTGTRDAVNGEFGLAWGHKKTGRGTVTDADCIVCHLEGEYATQTRSSVHGDGYIDLRDPDGSGEDGITDIDGKPFRFAKFVTSYTGTVRFSNGHLRNDIDNVLTQKFCIACHDNNGATNPTARSNNGGTGTAYMPFGGVNLGANYTVQNGAAVAGGVIDVKTQFATTNSSVHPVLGPLNRDYPAASRLAVPYNNHSASRGASGGTKSLSVVINCFDCHNTPTTPFTTRTVAAHGNNATLRGDVYTNPYTLCQVCHTGYTVANNHGAGSAMASSTGRSGEGFNSGCYSCHGDSGDTDGGSTPTTVRPVRGQGYHGFNTLIGGGVWPTGGGKPYAFIRNTETFAGGYHRPLRGIGELTTGSATCGGNTGCVGNGSARTYTPGGQY